MLSPLPVQTRLADVTSPPDRLPGWLGDATMLGRWVVGIVVGSFLGLWLTGRTWGAVAVGIAGMVLLAWRLVKVLAALRAALDRTERERAALQEVLRTSQKMDALGRLTVGVAHDFNNHLTVISSNIEMLTQRLDGSQERLLRHAAAAMQGVQRAAALTGRLLSFSRRPVSEAEMVDVNRLLGGLADLLGRTLGERVGLKVVASDEAWFTWADVNQMENALLSLAVNVRDQVRNRATLTITVSNAHLDPALERVHPSVLPGDYIQITVANSSGARDPTQWLPADDLSCADLSMARAFAREGGGMILRSESTAAGLSLRLFLPRYVPPAPATIALRRGPGEPPTILVVEDDDLVRDSCVKILRELNYDVLEAPDAMEACAVKTASRILVSDEGSREKCFRVNHLTGR